MKLVATVLKKAIERALRKKYEGRNVLHRFIVANTAEKITTKEQCAEEKSQV